MKLHPWIIVTLTLYASVGAGNDSGGSNDCQTIGSPCTVEGAVNKSAGDATISVIDKSATVTVGPGGAISINGSIM